VAGPGSPCSCAAPYPIAASTRSYGWRPTGREGRKRRKIFFFEKKKQKTFACWAQRFRMGSAQMNKSFLVLFFKKELLPSPKIVSANICWAGAAAGRTHIGKRKVVPF
jgi:hypothetical protein